MWEEIMQLINLFGAAPGYGHGHKMDAISIFCWLIKLFKGAEVFPLFHHKAHTIAKVHTFLTCHIEFGSLLCLCWCPIGVCDTKLCNWLCHDGVRSPGCTAWRGAAMTEKLSRLQLQLPWMSDCRHQLLDLRGSLCCLTAQTTTDTSISLFWLDDIIPSSEFQL